MYSTILLLSSFILCSCHRCSTRHQSLLTCRPSSGRALPLAACPPPPVQTPPALASRPPRRSTHPPLPQLASARRPAVVASCAAVQKRKKSEIPPGARDGTAAPEDAARLATEPLIAATMPVEARRCPSSREVRVRSARSRSSSRWAERRGCDTLSRGDDCTGIGGKGVDATVSWERLDRGEGGFVLEGNP
eukprot:scaffold14353_cov74-Isochrysis_galbana.AAC.1